MVSSRLSPIGVLGVAVIASAGLAVVGDAAGALALPSAAAALVALAALIRVGFGARRDRGVSIAPLSWPPPWNGKGWRGWW